MSFVADGRVTRGLVAIACALVIATVSAAPATAADDDSNDSSDKTYVLEKGPCDLDELPEGAVALWTPRGESIVHEVAYGEGLQDIAKKYGIMRKKAFRVLWDANPQLDQLWLERAGITIRIPTCDAELTRRKLPEPPPPPEPEPEAPAAESGGADSPDSAPAPAPEPEPEPAPAVSGDSVWDKLAQCESGGNWAINTGNGYYGGLQFSAASWRAVGGSGLPHEHSREEQIKRGKILQQSGGWGQWPACSAKLGLR